MNELLKIVLSLSLSGTLLFFIILALKLLYKHKLGKRWQYYIWLIVVVRMLLPFTPETTLIGTAFQYFENIHIHVETDPIAPTPDDSISDAKFVNNYIAPNEKTPKQTIDTAPSLSIPAILSKAYEYLWILWGAIAFALLIRKITMYQSFVRFVKVGRTEVSHIGTLNMLADAGEAIGVKRPVELYTNPLISSPMLLGFFRPYIILPTIEIGSTQLAYILRHELTHCKHLDMFYKWLVQITVCLHWFNPFVYQMAKEINRCCELSCDEAIITTLDKEEKKAYGDTLLSALQAMGQYNDKLATVTLTEGAVQLKERLDAIMKYKKKSKTVIVITLALTVMLCSGATAIGAYAAGPKTDTPFTAVGKSDLVSLAKEYYENGELVTFSFIFSMLDQEIQKEYCARMIEDGKTAFLSIVAKNMDSDMMDWCAEKTYQEDKIALFAVIAPYFTKDQKDAWVVRASREKKNSFLAVLTQQDSNSQNLQGDGAWGEGATRQESLITSFAPYRDYGLVYNEELDRAFFNGQEIKAFVDIREMNPGGEYSFNFGYIEGDSASTLYLMAVRDGEGLLTGVEQMTKELQNDLYGKTDEALPVVPYNPDLEGEIEDSLSEISGSEEAITVQGMEYMVFDATTHLDDSSIIATDKINAGDIPETIADWIVTCQGSDGVSVKKTTAEEKSDAWVYYDSDERMAWSMRTDGTTIKLTLTDNAPKSISGATLIHYQAPAQYQDLEVSFKGEKLDINVQ